MIKNRITRRVFFSLLTLVLLVSTSGEAPVNAQTTTLSLAPLPLDTPTALTCTDTVVAVRVENVTNLIAYDIWLKFTPASLAVIEVWGVANGSFLTEGAYVFQVIDNEAGTIHIAMTQLAGDPVSGSGDLVYIQLRALVPGATFEIGFDENAPEPTQLTNSSYQFISFTSTDRTYTTADCEPAELSFDPSPATLCVGYPMDIFVRVDNVFDLYSYDLDLSFNPGAVEISSVTNAGFLSAGIQIPSAPLDRFDNTLGTVNLANTQIISGTNLPKDGSGNLIKITLQATTPGQTVVFNILDTSMIASWSDYYTSAEIEYTASLGTYYTAICDPTAVIFGDLDAQLQADFTSVKVTWNTFSEFNLAGFNVLRSESLTDIPQQINGSLIPAIFHVGGEHFFIDDTVIAGHTYYYWIQAVLTSGNLEELGPKEIFAGLRIFLPMINHH